MGLERMWSYMKKMMHRAAALALCLVLALSAAPAALAAGTPLERTADYVCQTVTDPTVGTAGGEWAVLALKRAGRLTADQEARYLENLQKCLEASGGVLSSTKYTEYARVVLALTALGEDPGSAAGYDLLSPLAECDKVVRQGINGAIWALIALRSAACTAWDVQSGELVEAGDVYRSAILAAQLSDGGWSLSGKTPADPDITAMALCALAPYQENDAVKAAVERGLGCLSAIQNDDGTFGAPTAESCAQVVLALHELGLSPDDARFTKGGVSALEALLTFARSDGSFSHVPGGAADQMATEQALCALAAQEVAGSFFLPETTGETPDLAIPAPGSETVTFPDIQGRADQSAIEDLARRGVLLGRSDGTFDPDASMTRGEFCAVVVRALGLKKTQESPFTDVPAWCADAVAAAYEAGIVRGTTATTFTPGGTITRQEAAVMLARAARYASGTAISYSQAACETLLRSGGSDWAQCGAWAARDVALCLQSGLLGGTNGTIRPRSPITRGEVAQSVAGLLHSEFLA